MIPITIAPRNANTTPVVSKLSFSLTEDSCVKGAAIMPQFVAQGRLIRYGGAANFCVQKFNSLIWKRDLAFFG
jgi:hypothetical protein